MVGRLRIAFLTTVLPHERRSGGEVVSQELIDALRAAGHDVTVIGWARPGAVAPPPGMIAAGERPIETAAAPRTLTARWFASALVRRSPYSVAKYRGDGYRRALAGHAPDVWIVDHAQAGWALPDDRRPLVYAAHNIEHALYEESAAGASGLARMIFRREARLTRRLEERLARRAALVWALTDEDADALRALGASGVTVLAVPGREPVRPADGTRSGVGLIGNWTWGPNAAGLRWFAEEVAPQLDPALAVVVAGSGADWLRGHPRITYAGRVEDVDEFLADARVIAIPSTAGAGVQVKTLDALAAGGWIVATSTALRGIASPPPSVTVADGPAEFAAALARLAAAPETERAASASIEWARRRGMQFREQVRRDLERIAP